MLERAAIWLATLILNYLFGRVTSAATEKAEEIKKDQERGEINEENIKAYEKAVERKERIDAALSLLNGDRP